MIKDIYYELRLMLKRITPAQAIVTELAEAEMALLKAETGGEYAQAAVTFNKSRVKRLKAYLNVPTEEKTA